MLGKTAAETVTKLREAFKEEALSQARVYEWFSRFKRGDMSLEDQPRSGRPSTSRTDENIQKIRDAIMFDRQKVRDAIMFDHHQTIDELEALAGVSWSSCQRILTEEPHMKRVASKFVPCLLSECIECAAVSHEKQDDKGFAPPPPYSPDLAPSDFFLFPRMKRDLKGKHFQNVEEVRKKTTKTLKAITLQEFQNCFEQWKSGGIIVLILKESILRVIKLWKCLEKYTIYEKKFLVIFGSPHVHVKIRFRLFDSGPKCHLQ